MSKLVVGYWDCPFCGSQGIRGDVANCPSCGRARGDVQFYMKDHSEGASREADERGDLEYLTEEQAKYISRNPDWYCSFCNSLNSDNAQFCANCGASRENSEANYFEMKKKLQEREQARAAAAARPQPQQKKGGIRPLFIILAVVLVIVGIFVFMNSKKTSGDLTVTGINWDRSIAIEENVMYAESGWSLPQGAEQTRTAREIHHYNPVLDHYESREVQRSRQVVDHYETYYDYKDLGNGTFEEIPRERPVYETEYYTETVKEPVYRNEPVYATKYYYNVWRWTPSREATASGDTHDTYWPDTNLTENEREGERKEEYRFSVTNQKNASSTYRLDEADWMNLNVGDNLFITAKRTGGKPYISDEKGNKIADLEKVK